MITIQGKGVSTGVAIGTLYYYHRADTDVKTYKVTDTAAEWERFQTAQSVAIEQLRVLAEKTRIEVGAQEAFLFETHQMLIKDLHYENSVEGIIKEEMLNAEAAVLRTAEAFEKMVASMDDSYMNERAVDVNDVSTRIVRILNGCTESVINSKNPVIVAANDLVSSEIVQLDKTKILGFITASGSGTSHAAILTRIMGIPAVVGVGKALKEEFSGKEVIIDGETGNVIIDPNDQVRAAMIRKQEGLIKQRKLLEQLKDKENVTIDGKKIRIYCNIGFPEDIAAVFENDGGGIGLFRSEFLYLNSRTYPTEEEQFEVYKKVLVDMKGKEVIIRTCDIGADKQIDYFELLKEENPAMGMRGLRISLERPEVFHTQLRALYRASVFGKLGIVFPMVTSVWEVCEAKKLCEIVKKELETEGILYSKEVELGIMIETPAAAILSDQLAKEVDFFSCGTNDLIQYTLACDRQNDDLDRFYDPHHMAVFRLLKLVCDNAHANGIRVGICGELAADLELMEMFLALGVDELSVSPNNVLPVRNAVRSIDTRETNIRLLKEIMGK